MLFLQLCKKKEKRKVKYIQWWSKLSATETSFLINVFNQNILAKKIFFIFKINELFFNKKKIFYGVCVVFYNFRTSFKFNGLELNLIAIVFNETLYFRFYILLSSTYSQLG